MATYSDGEMALAYLGEDLYPYIALYKQDGTRVFNIRIAQNMTFGYVSSCKVNDDSMMVMISDKKNPPNKRSSFYKFINKNRTY